MKHLLFAVVCLLFAGACKKDATGDLELNGYVVDHRNNSGLSGVNARLEEQVVAGGALNSQFELAAETVTDASGRYVLSYPRQNALTYRLDLTKEGYFSKRIELNPDNFRPGEPVSENAVMTTEAFFQVRLVNQSPFSDEDEIKYRNLDANFSCECCDNDWVVATGANVDTTFTCRMHGDYLLHFTYEISKDSDTTIVDSVYCPAFQTTPVTIYY